MMPRRTGRLFRFFDDMEREIDMAFEDLLSCHPMWDSATGRLEPLTQVREALNKIVVTMDLPMVHKEDIHLTIEEDHLELQAPLDHCVRYEHWGFRGTVSSSPSTRSLSSHRESTPRKQKPDSEMVS